MHIVSLVGLKIHKNYKTKLGQGYCLDYHLLKWSEVKLFSHVWLFATPWLLCPWDFLGKNTGVGCHFLLQGIFLTQGSNPGLPHCRQMLYPLSHQGSHHLLLEAKKTSILLIWPRLCDHCEVIWAEFSHSKVSYKRGQEIFGALG